MKKHDYGLGERKQRKPICEQMEKKPHKKVIMSGVWMCKNLITVNKIIKSLKGLGINELEEAEAVMITEAIVDAINSKQSTADITKAFNVEFQVYNKTGHVGTITKEAISETLYERLFKKIYEDDEKIVVKLKWRCLL